jgi:CubicO group peptidase (beta-lactamase class C family)
MKMHRGVLGALASSLCILFAFPGGRAGAGQAASCEPGGHVGPLAERIGAHLDEAVARGFSGAVLVERDDEVIHCSVHGWSDSTRVHPVTPRTLFFVASITKQFTAAGILLLEEEGALEVADSIGKFFPALTGSPARITLHQLLTHTAGLTQNYMMDGIAVRDSAVAAVFASFPPNPGREFNYTNDSYGILAAVIEVASGQSYESFVTRRLLEPAGMEHTTFWGFADDLDAGRFAQKFAERSTQMRSPNWGYRGSVGIWSSVVDLYRWYRFAWRGSLLSESSRRLLIDRHVTLPSGTGIGYGTYTSTTTRGTTEIWTRGTEDFGHSAAVRWFPSEGVLIIVLSNSGEIDGTYANQLISDEIVELLFE